MVPKGDDDYMFSRGYQDSARLVLQHCLWLYRIKYVLNPCIPAKDENLKIADVGTGNAVWLMELLPHIPASTYSLTTIPQKSGFPTTSPSISLMPLVMSSNI